MRDGYYICTQLHIRVGVNSLFTSSPACSRGNKQALTMRSDLRRLLSLASLKHFSPSLDHTARLDSEDTVRKDFDILCCSFTHVQVQVRFPGGTMQYNRRETFGQFT